MIESIPYQKDSSTIFAYFAGKKWSIFLDSANNGRYDILAFEPSKTLQTVNGLTTISSNDQKPIKTHLNPFTLLKNEIQLTENFESPLPFNGGWLGYFSYDLARLFINIPNHNPKENAIPEMQMGFYTKVIVFDHLEQQGWFINHDNTLSFAEVIKNQPSRTFSGFELQSDFQSNLSKNDYKKAFSKIQNYLIEGDCYQINFAQQFCASYTGDPWLAYLTLRKKNCSPYSAFLNFPETNILSFSPEQFVSLDKDRMQTKPIKGTRPRSSNSKQDLENQQALLNSEKDKAENLMIVDLLRNDLGKVAKYGSISVPKLFELESFANVHHLVSTVEGVLRTECNAADILYACFPGGSITGAPKQRAMQIIEELEPNRRNIYCGSIGYIDLSGNMNTNIAIRTLYTTKHQIFCYGGGAIVIDSECEAEYQECFDKINILLEGLKGSIIP